MLKQIVLSLQAIYSEPVRFLVLLLLALSLQVIFHAPVLGQNRSTETSCRSSSGRFPHPNRQPCQPRWSSGRGR